MHSKLVTFTLILSLLIEGCASEGKTTLLGAGIGAGVGAGIGSITDGGPKGKNRIRNVFIGAAAGSLLGAGTGFLTHELVEKKENEAFEKGKKDGKNSEISKANDSTQPTLIPPRVEARFVEDQIRSNTFVPAHFEFQIVEPARWQK